IFAATQVMAGERRKLGRKFATYPRSQSFHAGLAAEEVLHDVLGGLGASGLEDDVAIALCYGTGEELVAGLVCELSEELQRDDLVVEIGVVVRGVADEVGEGGVHAVAVYEFVLREAVVAFAKEGVEVELGGAAIVSF